MEDHNSLHLILHNLNCTKGVRFIIQQKHLLFSSSFFGPEEEIILTLLSSLACDTLVFNQFKVIHYLFFLNDPLLRTLQFSLHHVTHKIARFLNCVHS